MEIRTLTSQERGNALKLAWSVFQEFEGPDYAPEGIATFKACLDDPEFTGRLTMYGAFHDDCLDGVIATRNSGSHIALLFVRGACHRQGIGRQLFDHVLHFAPGRQMTVNSSPYALKVYEKLGFSASAPEQLTDGIRFIPMTYQGDV